MTKYTIIIGAILLVLVAFIWTYSLFGINEYALPTIKSKLGHGSAKDINALQLQSELTENTIECIRRNKITDALSSKQIADLLRKDTIHKYKYRPEEDEATITDDNRIIDHYGNEYNIASDGKFVKTQANGVARIIIESIDTNIRTYK
jgi:hypothetical protein